MLKHRDLHLGNVCIKTTRADGCMEPPSDLEIMRQSWTSGFGLSTLETTIIDYSLSRAELRTGDNLDEIAAIASSDLDKKQIFDAIGRDEDEILLRDTYRQ
jgi:serine/threonine-protein kinase haspin